jgi:3-mercaptopyruvate sulfurtransferase SseA
MLLLVARSGVVSFQARVGIGNRVSHRSDHAMIRSPFNQAPKDVPRVSIAELKQLMAKKQALVVDVRDKVAFANGHIPGATNILFDDIPNHVEKLAKDKRVIVTYCA